ncbi:helix-turn-helix transcriptional regulator [Pseudoclavibacter sp. CFCC 13611]|nr:helix-turn-helix transcriptional regulator [Pseudoclavibacter sp. CFCC 13611]
MPQRGELHPIWMPRHARLTAHAQQDWQRFMADFGLLLAQVRRERGFSQEYVAAQAGMAPYTYVRYEQGRGQDGRPANLTLINLICLANALHVRVEDIIPDQYPDIRLD